MHHNTTALRKAAKWNRRLPWVGRLYRQRDRARMERDAALQAAQAAASQSSGGHFVLCESLGLSLLLDPRNLADRRVLETGTFEPEQQALCGAVLKHWQNTTGATACFVDVGTNWGLYSLQVAKNKLAQHVVALEPDPINRAHFAANMLLNNVVEDITLHPAAAWHSVGTVAFQNTSLKTGARDRGWAQVADVSTEQSHTTIDVPATTVDAVVPADATHVYLKIDTEGAEAQALQGASQTLQAKTVCLQIECEKANRAALAPFARAPWHKVGEYGVDVFYTNDAALAAVLKG